MQKNKQLDQLCIYEKHISQQTIQRKNPDILSYQFDLLAKALCKYEKHNLSSSIIEIVQNLNDFSMGNPHAIKSFSNIFVKEFIKITNLKDVYSCCLIDQKFDFGSYKENFKPNKAKKHFKQLLEGLDYIGVVTFSAYKNRKEFIDEGLLRSVHCHFILLSDKKLTRSQRKKIKRNLTFDRTDCIPLVAERYSVAEAVSYCWKPPIYTAYSSVCNNKTGRICNVRSKPTLKQVFTYYNQFADLEIDQWTIAGGKGVDVWKQIKEQIELQKELNPCHY